MISKKELIWLGFIPFGYWLAMIIYPQGINRFDLIWGGIWEAISIGVVLRHAKR